MYRITQRVHFCYGHRLMGYGGGCRHLHGHNAVVELTFEAPELDSSGMVVDFALIKQRMTKWIDETLDHRMILQKEDPLLAVLKEHGEPVVPLDGRPTVENLARLIWDQARKENLPIADVKIWETAEQSGAYSTD